MPQDILESAGRVWEYHLASKLTEQSPPSPAAPASAGRVFDYLPKVALSPKLLDLPTATMTILTKGVDALPESLQAPPQDVRTLSTWLYMAAGQRNGGPARPGEVYVAAFAVDGVPPGLYHFSAGEFALRRLREGPETLALLRRGRPDLNFLATAPAALLVSTVLARGIAQQGRRGYRAALLDAGHLVADCVAAATGLGMRTMTRLRMSDASTRELIGLPDDADASTAEGVQAMVVWADPASRPMPPAAPPDGPLATLPRPAIAAPPRRAVDAGRPPRGHRPRRADDGTAAAADGVVARRHQSAGRPDALRSRPAEQAAARGADRLQAGRRVL